jgi:hypothetical protein
MARDVGIRSGWFPTVTGGSAMSLEIFSYARVGEFELGMSISDARVLAGASWEPLEEPHDGCPARGRCSDAKLFLEYDKSDRVVSVEMYAPADPIFFGHHLLQESFGELLEWFPQIDPEVKIEGDGLTSAKFGVALWADSAEDEPGELVESVMVFERGYYERDY